MNMAVHMLPPLRLLVGRAQPFLLARGVLCAGVSRCTGTVDECLSEISLCEAKGRDAWCHGRKERLQEAWSIWEGSVAAHAEVNAEAGAESVQPQQHLSSDELRLLQRLPGTRGGSAVSARPWSSSRPPPHLNTGASQVAINANVSRTGRPESGCISTLHYHMCPARDHSAYQT